MSHLYMFALLLIAIPLVVNAGILLPERDTIKRDDCSRVDCPDGETCRYIEYMHTGMCFPARGSIVTARKLRNLVRMLDTLTPDAKRELDEKLEMEEIKELLAEYQ